MQGFIAEFICNLFAEFIAGFVAEIQPVKVDVRKKVPGKGSKLDVLVREMRSTEKISAGYVGRDLLNAFEKQEGNGLKNNRKSGLENKSRCTS